MENGGVIITDFINLKKEKIAEKAIPQSWVLLVCRGGFSLPI
jgi:hypothetical protein